MRSQMLLTALALSASAASASAGIIDLQYLGRGLGRSVHIDVSGSGMNVFAGQLRHRAGTTTGPDSIFNNLTLNTYCVDLAQHTSKNWTPFTITDISLAGSTPMGAAKGDAIRDAFAYLYAHPGLQVNNDTAAGFQLALWEIVSDYDTGIGRSSLDFTAGTFKAQSTNGNPLSSAVANWATTFFNAIGGERAPVSVIAFASNRAQDQAVPTPGIGALALLGLVALRRRR